MSLPFTVVSIHPEMGQIVSDHVVAADAEGAFVAVCQMSEREGNELVLALPGHVHAGQGAFFPGESLVDTFTYMES